MKKILIVDDSMAMVRMIQSVLEKEGYHAIGISDPSQIEQTIDSEEPSLILLDVVMPERNGFQVCRALKNSQTYKSIPDHRCEWKIDAERPLLGRATGRERIHCEAV